MTLKKIFIVFIALVCLAFAGYIAFRGTLLTNALNKIQEKAFTRYKVKLNFGEAHFEGLARVSLSQVSIVPPNGDTLFYCRQTAGSFSLYRFIKGQPPLNHFLLNDGFLNFVNYSDSTTNYSFLFDRKSKSKENPEVHQRATYSETISKLWNNFFGLADFNFNITGFHIIWKNLNTKERLTLQNGSLNKTQLNIHAINELDGKISKWKLQGTIDPGEDIIDMHVATTDSSVGQIPFIEQLTGVKFSLNSFGLSASLNRENQNTVRFNLTAAAVKTGINHWRISPDDVLFDSVGVRMNIFISDTAIYTGPESVVIVNQLPLKTDIGFSKKTITLIHADINTMEMDAGTFFNSLPHGLFNTLEGIKVKGRVEYHLKARVNLDAPDSLVFDSELKRKDFKIVSYGRENFASINNSFVYTAREKDKVVRVFTVGPENPMYTPFTEMNPVLISTVLTSEDGTFYFHRGFNEDAFRQSIATNIREKRFARGGSTVSMQLVKNVFLNRNKTVSRKVEEAIIVWLIENNHLVSKDRILEVYFNIIEWGPGIYGIGEAADFYFSKKPSQLTLDECIYLASIIPRPKYFKYSFNKDGTLKEYLKSYFQLVAGRLVKKEIITQGDFDLLKYQVELKGPALQMVLPLDSIPNDSLMHEEPEELF